MTITNKKHEILASLDSLDQTQADKVLEYIKGLLYSSYDDTHKVLKREALKEIRKALRNKSKVNLAF